MGSNRLRRNLIALALLGAGWLATLGCSSGAEPTTDVAELPASNAVADSATRAEPDPAPTNDADGAPDGSGEEDDKPVGLTEIGTGFGPGFRARPGATSIR